MEPIRRDQVVPPFLPHQKWTISDENHMEIFARLARIKVMHNPPGPQKPRKSG